MTFTTDESEFDIKAFERRYRRCSFTADEIIDAYNRVAGVSPGLDKFMRSLSSRPSGRVDTKSDDDGKHFVYSVLVDRSPAMSAVWPDVLKGINNRIAKLNNYEGNLHFGMHLVDRQRRTLQDFDDIAKMLPEEIPIGKGPFAL